jgi:hypothetical protein
MRDIADKKAKSAPMVSAMPAVNRTTLKALFSENNKNNPANIMIAP